MVVCMNKGVIQSKTSSERLAKTLANIIVSSNLCSLDVKLLCNPTAAQQTFSP